MKILLIRNDRIGDLILTLGALKSIRQKYPDSEITFLASSLNAPLLEKNKDINHIITIDNWWHKKSLKSFCNYLKMIKRIRKEKFDIGIEFRGGIFSIIFYLWLGRIKKTIAPIWDSLSQKGKKYVTNAVHIKWQDKHSIMCLKELLVRGFGEPFHINYPEIACDEADRKEVSTKLADLFKCRHPEDQEDLPEYICIAPGAGNDLQRWDEGKFDELIRRLDAIGENIILVGGEDDRKLIERLQARNPFCLSLINYNIRLLSLIFSNKLCKEVICNDGGAMHISWASGARTIALWGPTNLEHVGPLRNSMVIQHPLPCYPCKRKEKGCPWEKGKRCMDLITVDEVIRK